MPLRNAVHLEVGHSTEFAFVFSCPGRKECEAQPPGPAKGETGNNLQELIRQLDQHQQLQSLHRGHARITNAWRHVEFIGRTGRTEPALYEVLERENLDRLSGELRDISRAIVCCGTPATTAVCRLAALGRLHDGVTVLVSPHLGQTRLNSMFPNRVCNVIQPPPENEDSSAAASRRRRLRVSLVADWVRAQAAGMFPTVEQRALPLGSPPIAGP